MRSSGQLITDRQVADIVCDNCGRHGDALERRDPEIQVSGWECPNCHAVTDTSDQEPDPDYARDLWLDNLHD